jgi:hypothetical protein
MYTSNRDDYAYKYKYVYENRGTQAIMEEFGAYCVNVFEKEEAYGLLYVGSAEPIAPQHSTVADSATLMTFPVTSADDLALDMVSALSLGERCLCCGKEDGCTDLDAGDGDCDSDNDCKNLLTCGQNNCGDYRSTTAWPDAGPAWDRTDDCCQHELTQQFTLKQNESFTIYIPDVMLGQHQRVATADVMVRCAFRQKFTLEDAIGSHACSLQANTLQANMRVTNGNPLGCSLLLPVDTVNYVQPLKVHIPSQDTTTNTGATVIEIRGQLGAASVHNTNSKLGDITSFDRNLTSARVNVSIGVLDIDMLSVSDKAFTITGLHEVRVPPTPSCTHAHTRAHTHTHTHTRARTHVCL